MDTIRCTRARSCCCFCSDAYLLLGVGTSHSSCLDDGLGRVVGKICYFCAVVKAESESYTILRFQLCTFLSARKRAKRKKTCYIFPSTRTQLCCTCFNLPRRDQPTSSEEAREGHGTEVGPEHGSADVYTFARVHLTLHCSRCSERILFPFNLYFLSLFDWEMPEFERFWWCESFRDYWGSGCTLGLFFLTNPCPVSRAVLHFDSWMPLGKYFCLSRGGTQNSLCGKLCIVYERFNISAEIDDSEVVKQLEGIFWIHSEIAGQNDLTLKWIIKYF